MNANIMTVTEFEKDLLRVCILDSINQLTKARQGLNDAGLQKSFDDAIQCRRDLMAKIPD